MKTTINIPDILGRQVKALARKRGITITAFIEESLRARLQQEKQLEKQVIKISTYRGKGDESVDLSWESIRDKVYP